MPTMDLDFLKTRPTAPWIRWILVTICFAFAADVGVSYYRIRHRIAQNEAGLAELRRTADGAASAALTMRAPTAEETQVARDTIPRLAMPWDKLFRALESAASGQVALLAIDPQAKSGTVLISGEAADYRAALDYVSELGRTGALDRPHLVRHERNPNGPLKPVRFSISASWSNPK